MFRKTAGGGVVNGKKVQKSHATSCGMCTIAVAIDAGPPLIIYAPLSVLRGWGPSGS